MLNDSKIILADEDNTAMAIMPLPEYEKYIRESERTKILIALMRGLTSYDFGKVADILNPKADEEQTDE